MLLLCHIFFSAVHYLWDLNDMLFIYFAVRYDEERNEWILPQMTVERTQLPTAPLDPTHATYRIAQCLGDQNDCFTTSASSNTRLSVSSLLNRDVERETEEEARYYAKLASRTQSQPNYFANRRASQLLIDAGSSSEVRKQKFSLVIGFP